MNVDNYQFPSWLYDKILYIEKKGFWPVIEAAKLAEKFDIAVICGEGFGNPFKVWRDGDQAAVIRKYEAWLLGQPELVQKVKAELRGKDLYCYCKPGEPCHGDVILRIANEGGEL